MTAKVAPYPTKEMQELFGAIMEIRSDEEAVNFFRDLLTPAELTEFASRWQIVKRLMHKESYLSIAKALNTSTTTVTRVAHWLHNGMGGYMAVAQRLYSGKKNPDYHKPPHFRSGKLAGMRKPNQL